MGRHLALARDRVERLATQESQDQLRLPLDAPALREFKPFRRRRCTARSRGRLSRVVLHARLLGSGHPSPDGVQGNRVRFTRSSAYRSRPGCPTSVVGTDMGADWLIRLLLYPPDCHALGLISTACHLDRLRFAYSRRDRARTTRGPSAATRVALKRSRYANREAPGRRSCVRRSPFGLTALSRPCPTGAPKGHRLRSRARRRSGPPKRRPWAEWRSSGVRPLPVSYLGPVLSVLGDVRLVLDPAIAHRLPNL